MSTEKKNSARLSLPVTCKVKKLLPKLTFKVSSFHKALQNKCLAQSSECRPIILKRKNLFFFVSILSISLSNTQTSTSSTTHEEH